MSARKGKKNGGGVQPALSVSDERVMKETMSATFGSLDARDCVAYMQRPRAPQHIRRLLNASADIAGALDGSIERIEQVAQIVAGCSKSFAELVRETDLRVHQQQEVVFDSKKPTPKKGAAAASASGSGSTPAPTVRSIMVLRYPVLLAVFAACIPPEWMWVLDGLTTYEWFELGQAVFRDTPLDKITPEMGGTPCVPFWLMQPQDVQCVIIGAWPYGRAHECMGYAFSSSYMTETLRDLKNAVMQDCYEGVLEGSRGSSSAQPFAGMQDPDLAPWAMRCGVMCLNTTWVHKNTRDSEDTHPLWLKLTRHVVTGVHERVGARSPLAVVMLGRDANAVVPDELERQLVGEQEEQKGKDKICRGVFRRHWLNRTGTIANTMLFLNVNVFRVWHGFEPLEFECIVR